MTIRVLPVALLAAAVMVSGCSASDKPAGPTSGPSPGASAGGTAPADPAAAAVEAARKLPVLARLEGTEFAKGVTLDLLGVERTSVTHVTARFLVTVGDKDVQGKQVSTFSLRGSSSSPAIYRGDGFADVRLVDEVAGEVLYPLQTAEQKCLCGNLKTLPAPGPSGAQAMFVTFPAVAATTSKVAVQVGGFPISPLVDVTGPGRTRFPGEASDGEAAAAKAIRLGLLSPSAALDGASRTVEQGSEVAVDVNSDVLFAFGSAELSGQARATLAGVAGEVRAQATGPVEVIGHTDTVGEAAANQALSEARARAVVGALQPQVGSLQLTASGRGESEPVVDDRGRGDSPEAGLNRRVSIRYTVAPPPPPPPAPSAPPVPTAPPTAGTPLATVSGGDRTFEVLGLRRLSDGMVQGTFRLTNTAATPENHQQGLDELSTVTYAGASLSGLRLVDKASGTAYAPLVDSGRECLCTKLLARSMAPGESTLLDAVFTAPPRTSSTVDISVRSFDQPLTGVPIS